MSRFEQFTKRCYVEGKQMYQQKRGTGSLRPSPPNYRGGELEVYLGGGLSAFRGPARLCIYIYIYIYICIYI